MVAPDDAAKVQVLNELLSALDVGFMEDRRVLHDMARRRELVHTIASPEKQRGIYDRLENLLPDNPYVLQHRSALERELRAPANALTYARRAVQLEPNNPVLHNTLGLALEMSARYSTDPLQQQAYLTEASRLFEEGITRAPTDAYGYLGRVLIMRHDVNAEKDMQRRAELNAEILAVLQEAYEATEESEMIAHELAEQQTKLGSTDEAMNLAIDALKRAPTNSRLRDLCIQYKTSKGEYDDALRIAQDGAKIDPTSWRMQRHIARLQRLICDNVDSIKGHYQSAIRHHKGDLYLMVEFGAFLFMNGLYGEANAVFAQASQIPAASQAKRKIRELWRETDGQWKVFRGRVKFVAGNKAEIIAIPENFSVDFYRSYTDLSKMREGDIIFFTVGFNVYGVVGEIAQAPRNN